MNASSAWQQEGDSAHLPRNNTAQINTMQKNKQILMWLGVFEIVLGLISCSIGLATVKNVSDDKRSFALLGTSFDFGQGIWIGMIFVMCGIFGVVARFKTTPCVYNMNTTMGILAVIAMLTLLILSVVSAACNPRSPMFPWYIILALIGLSGFIIAVIHIFFSRANDARTKRERRAVYTAVPQAQPQMFPVRLPNGQIIYYPSQAFYPVGFPMNFGQINNQTTMSPVMQPVGQQPGCIQNAPCADNVLPSTVLTVTPNQTMQLQPTHGGIIPICHPANIVMQPPAMPAVHPSSQATQPPTQAYSSTEADSAEGHPPPPYNERHDTSETQ